MLRPQQMTVYISSVGTQQVHRPTHLIQLPNTKMEFGQMLETWPKLDIRMVQSPPDLQPWLSVVIHMNHICKCIFEQESKLDLSFFYFNIKCENRAMGIRFFRKRHYPSNFVNALSTCWLVLGRRRILQQELRRIKKQKRV